MCLENISKNFTVNIMNKLGLNSYIYECSVKYNIIDYISIDSSNIINIHKNLMKKYDIK